MADEKMLNEDYEVTVYDGEGYDEYPEESGNRIARVAIGLVGSAVAAVGTAVAQLYGRVTVCGSLHSIEFTLAAIGLTTLAT